MATIKVLIHRNPQFGICPSCKAVGSLRRSRSKTMAEQIIRKVTFFKMYRCKECDWRGYKSTLIFTKKSFKNLIIYIIIILLTIYLTQYLILTDGLN